MHSRRALPTAAVIAAMCSTAPGAQAPRGEQLLNMAVGPDTFVRLPPIASNLGESLASLAKSTGVLIGFETVMDNDERFFAPGSFNRSLEGLTVAQALDQIVASDPRYEWREHHGVIHVRPLAAFQDRNHFLNRRVAQFKLENAIPLHATFEVHRVYRPDCEIRHPIYTEDRDGYLSKGHPSMRTPVTLSLTNVTVIEIMDAVISAHGQLYWNLTYHVPSEVRQPESARYEYAVFSFHEMPAVGGWWRMCVGDERRYSG
jgi:hypothetical protein